MITYDKAIEKMFETFQAQAKLHGKGEILKTADEILVEMSETFKERNKTYGDNYLMVGKVMADLFPNGVTLNTPDDFNRWHLFELTIVKLTRFTISGMRHEDSIHDSAVYAAMVRSLTNLTSKPLGES